MIHDVVIVGSGPAGYTAAIYAAPCPAVNPVGPGRRGDVRAGA